jgi:uncharacterized protein YkwD
LRKYAVALLAVPILAIIYAGAVLRRSSFARAGAAIALGAVVAASLIAVVRPSPTEATAPTAIVPLTQAAFRTLVTTGVELDAAQTIQFSTPMDRESVAASIAVDPPTPVALHWDPTGTLLSIGPAGHWQVGRFHTITVEPGALALTGRPLTTPARASFLTRSAATAALTATAETGTRVGVGTTFTVSFDRAVDLASVRAGLRLDPAATGTITSDTTLDGLPRFTFTPDAPLAADTTYRLVVDGVRDDDGIPVEAAALEVQTAVAPEVVRFRPRDDTKKVDRGATVSVRFTTAMDHATTKAAFSLTADGKAVAGKLSWAEGSTVLVFDPTKKLPYHAKVVVTVGAGATSRDGSPITAAATGRFTTETKPKPKATTRPRSSGGSTSSGGSVGSGSWGAVERYYLGLMNCTRQGGWVDSGGHCDSPGGRSVAALKLSSGISTKVSRPYAKLLATRNLCSHFVGGNPGDRLRRAGYTSYRWAENLGCRSGNPYDAVLASHRYFQSEKSYSGGHYVNLMNAKYDRVGIGVWVSHGRVRLVIDFYHP